MNRDEKSSNNRGDRRPDRGVRGDLRGRLPGHQRPPGGRAARQTARGRRQLPHRQEPPDQNRRRQGRRGAPRRAAAGPDRPHLRPRRHRPGGEGDLELQQRARRAHLQGRLHGRASASTRTASRRSPGCPRREVLNGQFAGVVASPLTGLVRGLGSMIQGLALQLGQIAEKGWSPARRRPRSRATAEEPAAETEPAAEGASDESADTEEAPEALIRRRQDFETDDESKEEE